MLCSSLEVLRAQLDYGTYYERNVKIPNLCCICSLERNTKRLLVAQMQFAFADALSVPAVPPA